MIESADELLRRDKRPPILYLRSFEDEDKEMTLGRAIRQSIFGGVVGGGQAPYWFEQEDISVYMNWVGPYITIARPGERKIVGAARKTVNEDQWKAVVSDFIHRTSFIILRAAVSSGLRWEIEEIVKRFDPTRLLVITATISADYRSFCQKVSSVLPEPLPHKIPSIRLVAFNE
uniref:Uncharacterized protein n=1 Tax=Chlorobium phaeobacteroides (strain BS1) TaxID=331678 RepID=B3EJX4_CHLPB